MAHVEQVAADDVECPQVQVVKRDDGVFSAILHHLSRFWPINLMIRAYRGIWYMFGFKNSRRLYRVTRVILAILPLRLRSAMGYPVSTSIGCALSPEIRICPTQQSGKGNKRKQDELDDEEAGQQTWVDALHQELVSDEESDEDPDYQPSNEEMDSEEYRLRNDTESDFEFNEQGVVIINEVDVPQASMAEMDDEDSTRDTESDIELAEQQVVEQQVVELVFEMMRRDVEAIVTSPLPLVQAHKPRPALVSRRRQTGWVPAGRVNGVWIKAALQTLTLSPRTALLPR
ncbi:hypothetical protein NHX12_033041 [Muraenolepis orangiensis]|uniref:Uncharacterized protein n=1 Tax=Muraenolepis orangiensis TaxID=630683 RepID=A0A9Q0E362_9TELE|nr:hypothetical protein NHX12_033041 [Muraenolepis orangiensis]